MSGLDSHDVILRLTQKFTSRIKVCEGEITMVEEPKNSVPQPPTFGIDEYNLKAVLEAAQDELVKLIQDRQSLEWRINKLQNDIVHLSALCHVEVDDPVAQLGLTDAVRWIFAREKKPLAVNEVVETLHRSYQDVSEYKNLAASVQPHIGLIKDLIPRMQAIEHAWRNRIIHVENRLIPSQPIDEPIAAELLTTVETFMRMLAEKLPAAIV